MVLSQAADVVRAALADTGKTLDRLPGRQAKSGLHEGKEFGPALRDSLVNHPVSRDRVALNHTTGLGNWNRPTSQVDLVVFGAQGGIDLAAELKVWDIGHQLFDLAKACCLLAAGVPATFLICVAKRDEDFDRLAGGCLFPATEGHVREHAFGELIATYRDEWRRHVGEGGPEPTSLPTTVITRAVSAGVAIDAYPGHSARAVEVVVTEPTPVTLTNSWPAAVSRPD